MKIRKLKSDDESQLLKLFAELTTSPINLNIQEVINDKNCHAIVLENKIGEIVGFAALTTFIVPTKGRVGKIEDVIIRETFRGKGLGSKLLDKLIEIAKEKGIVNITLTSNPSRIIARNLYQKKGFILLETGVFLLKL